MRALVPGFLLISSISLSHIFTLYAPQAGPQRRVEQPAMPANWAAAWEDLEGTASWYSVTDPGVVALTASTERFNDRDLTCAMWGVPFNARLKVTNLHNGRSVIVRVNDRGPAEDLVLTQDRVIDLTKTAFAAIAEPGQGLIRVRVELDRPLLLSSH